MNEIALQRLAVAADPDILIEELLENNAELKADFEEIRELAERGEACENDHGELLDLKDVALSFVERLENDLAAGRNPFADAATRADLLELKRLAEQP